MISPAPPRYLFWVRVGGSSVNMLGRRKRFPPPEKTYLVHSVGYRKLPMDNVKLDFQIEHSKRTFEEVRALRISFDDMRGRVQSLETNYVDLRREMVNMHADIIRMDHRLDGFDQRLTRIERRLDLVST